MKHIIALSGRKNVGKTHCLGHLINLISNEINDKDFMVVGRDIRTSFDYHGKKIIICTFGDNEKEENDNINFIKANDADIAVVATRTKGSTLNIIKDFSKKYTGKGTLSVEKYVQSIGGASEEDTINLLQAKEILNLIKGKIFGMLYYVDSVTQIVRISDNNIQDTGSRNITLIAVEENEKAQPRFLHLVLNENQLRLSNQRNRTIEEDDFVMYHPDEEILFSDGNQNPLAISWQRNAAQVREALGNRFLTEEDIKNSFNNNYSVVKSYHINVGHGNCSIIQLKVDKSHELWMVDCSHREKPSSTSYTHNIEACFDEIAKELRVNVMSLRIRRFMLTHTHFDHYNGLKLLIDKGWIDRSTIIYMNLKYRCSSKYLTQPLNDLYNLGCKFVCPIKQNPSTPLPLSILYPDKPTFKNKNDVPTTITSYRIENSVNNSSVVYRIGTPKKSIVFPGDLEKKGFLDMSGRTVCTPHIFSAIYYCISHHGSLTGHPFDMPCIHVPTVLECINHQLDKAILMGRDHAYNGIYDPQVITDFGKKIIYTEKNPSGHPNTFVEIDWSTGNVIYK